MAQKQPFSTTLTNLIARVTTNLGCNDQYVRAQAQPSNWGEYTAEEGLSFLVGPPEPDSTSGAGRWGLKVRRRLNVIVVTNNTLDVVSRDELALTYHLDLEESTVNAIFDGHPGTPTPEGITVNWVPGGAEITRALPQDTARITSVMCFDCTYVADLTPGPYSP